MFSWINQKQTPKLSIGYKSVLIINSENVSRPLTIGSKFNWNRFSGLILLIE